MRRNWLIALGVVIVFGLLAGWAIASLLSSPEDPEPQPAIRVTAPPPVDSPSPAPTAPGTGPSTIASPSPSQTPTIEPTTPQQVSPAAPNPVDDDDDDDDDDDHEPDDD